MGEWIANNIGMLVGWVIGVLSLLWAIATKFAKMEQKDDHQEDRIKILEKKYEANHQLHVSNELRLVALEVEMRSTKDLVVEMNAKLDKLASFIMDRGAAPCPYLKDR